MVPVSAPVALRVSIRAPAWRATLGQDRGDHRGGVSIRAPAWRATDLAEPRHQAARVSIRAPAWRATVHERGGERVAGVSIRAPAWRATRACARAPPRARRFNPRPRMEGDAISSSSASEMPRFQSAPPHGGRLRRVVAACRGLQVSIRAPAWRATNAYIKLGWREDVSIRAPAWRATRRRRRHGAPVHVSIRAPAWRATSLRASTHEPVHVSIRAPAWRATSPLWYRGG